MPLNKKTAQYLLDNILTVENFLMDEEAWYLNCLKDLRVSRDEKLSINDYRYDFHERLKSVILKYHKLIDKITPYLPDGEVDDKEIVKLTKDIGGD